MATSSVRIACIWAACLAFLLALGQGSVLLAQNSRLELVEEGSYSVPDSFALSGVSASPSGRLVIWSHQTAYMDVLNDSLEHLQYLWIPSGAKPLFVAFVTDTTIEFVSQSVGEVYQISLSGAIERRSIAQTESHLISAARGEKDWVFLIERSDGVVALQTAGHSPKNTNPMSGRYIASGLEAGWLCVLGEEIIVTDATYPYTVKLFGYVTGHRMTLHPPLAQIDSLRQAQEKEKPDGWVSLSALPLDRGYLQTISDLGGDSRVLVRYDQDGLVASTRIIMIPIGFAASIPSQNTLIGVRQINRVDIVKYRWRWSNDMPHQ